MKTTIFLNLLKSGALGAAIGSLSLLLYLVFAQILLIVLDSSTGGLAASENAFDLFLAAGFLTINFLPAVLAIAFAGGTAAGAIGLITARWLEKHSWLAGIIGGLAGLVGWLVLLPKEFSISFTSNLVLYILPGLLFAGMMAWLSGSVHRSRVQSIEFYHRKYPTTVDA